MREEKYLESKACPNGGVYFQAGEIQTQPNMAIDSPREIKRFIVLTLALHHLLVVLQFISKNC